MNIRKVKYLPLLVVALGLAACSKDSGTEGSGAVSAPATSAARIDTLFEADCGGTTASAAGAFDISQCELNNQQVTVLQKLQPLKVEANCAARSVRVYYADGQLAGQGALSDEGIYQVPLQVEQGFSVLENGCPMTLEGTASGTVACETDAEGATTVASVKLDTAFNLAAIPTSAVTANVEAAVGAADHHQHKGGKQEPVVMPSPAPKGKGEPTATPAPKGAPIVTEPKDGKKDAAPVVVPAPSPAPKDGKGAPIVTEPKDGKKDAVVPAPSATPAPKGGDTPKKGEQKGGQGPDLAGGSRVDACVSLNPCVFNSSASLSCSR